MTSAILAGAGSQFAWLKFKNEDWCLIEPKSDLAMINAYFSNVASELVETGRQLAKQGMVPATSGNFSARLTNGDIAITQSGVHKGKMTKSHIMMIDADGVPLDENRPSAETQLHVQIYKRYPQVNAVIHVHSQRATLISQLEKEKVTLRQYELLKALPGIDTHDTQIDVPIFDNDQDIARLADKVDTFMAVTDPVHAYLIQGHGIYTWGESIQEALKAVEALDFLFACEIEKRRL